ncbi:aldehyde dehydrogenase family protein [Microbulbifer thermotolerans]|uniref:aldehyde dehydrogenase family protein n=1 Tax=Microbulbifer thermotolerans TaxID=252514 RepID=UPI00224AEDB9|nr:aldehyde dehydrogenase family protein [Microbulbifer thermotolerans]MCX2781506.1 aldehyde dehydrogenase family protein [Microbulbifer thermotolerans]
MKASALESQVRLPPEPDSGFDAAALVAGLRTYFRSGTTADIGWRRRQLEQLRSMLSENEARFLDALAQDLHKAPQEGYMTEISGLYEDIAHTLKYLKKWVRPRRVSTPLIAQPAKSYMLPEPLGVVLIIGAWNYPLQLLLSPLVPAIAAGNCAVLKPSELAPATSRLVAELLPRYLDGDAFICVEGAVPETTALLEQRWDHIFYTGGGQVGRIVMAAAAKHLTPVTLELGGKSPCIVADDANIALAARRIAWGKFLNAGQTCIAPDYLLCSKTTADRLLPEIEKSVRAMFGDDPRKSPDYGRIVNSRHAHRLASYLSDGEVVFGGQVDADARYVAPTLLRNVGVESAVMQEEIFGPVLPVVELNDISEAEAFVNEREKPLALYVFTQSDATADHLLARCSSGNACVNDCVMFMANSALPFGGVGASGMGAYHGEHGFRTFSHFKAVMKRRNIFDLSIRYAPFSAWKFKLLRLLR